MKNTWPSLRERKVNATTELFRSNARFLKRFSSRCGRNLLFTGGCGRPWCQPSAPESIEHESRAGAYMSFCVPATELSEAVGGICLVSSSLHPTTELQPAQLVALVHSSNERTICASSLLVSCTQTTGVLYTIPRSRPAQLVLSIR